jgi:DNA-binding CsgD family transcriptional regulator
MDNRIRFYNTIGQDFEQLNKLDSAIVYFDSSLALAEKTQQHVWTGISSGYKGEVLFKLNEYRKAKPLLEIDYAINKNIEEDIAAKSLQWLARIDLAEGKNDSALVKSSEALQVLSKAEFNYYLQRDRIREMCYYTLAESYKAINKVDSFEYYDQLKINLHDSLARIALESSMRMLQTKIANENIQHAVKELQAERASEAKKRNLVIAGVVLLAAMFILYIKRVKLKQQHRADLLLREKRMAETELASAREQLQQFTTGIIEKTNLIEKLNLQIEGKDPNTYGLINKTTLTESTWENFKATFEKIHPNFFASLKEKAANITMAEQRMAALIKLNLNARQMATILGISVDSVHKAKQRLRQRMQVQNEIMLEETLADL